jgi:hypothetical protein
MVEFQEKKKTEGFICCTYLQKKKTGKRKLNKMPSQNPG